MCVPILGTFSPRPVAEVPDVSVGLLSIGLEPFTTKGLLEPFTRKGLYPGPAPEDSVLDVDGLEES